MKPGLNNAFLGAEQLGRIGFASLGRNVLVHPLAVIHGAGNIHLGDDVRIDPFSVLSAISELHIGAYSHVHSHCSLVASMPLRLGAFCNLSHGVVALTVSDDFNGSALLGSMVPESLRRPCKAPLTLEDHVNVGANSVLLPGTFACEGSALGALSLAKNRLEPWTLYAGIPARAIRPRARSALALGRELLAHAGPSQPDANA